MHVRSLNRWLFSDNEEERLIQPEISVQDGERFVSFVNLVEILAIAAARRADVSLQSIRSGIQRAEKEYRRPHLLARKIAMYKLGENLLIEYDDGTVVGATRRVRNQHFMKRIVSQVTPRVLDSGGNLPTNVLSDSRAVPRIQIENPRADELTYDESGLANSLTLMYGTPKSKMHVTIDPRFRAGAPRVMPCGYEVETLVNAVIGEGSVKAAAETYNVDPQAVKLALRFENEYRKAA